MNWRKAYYQKSQKAIASILKRYIWCVPKKSDWGLLGAAQTFIVAQAVGVCVRCYRSGDLSGVLLYDLVIMRLLVVVFGSFTGLTG